MRRLTLAMLCACWTIYTSNISAVLSLPPSLIASAASLQQRHDEQQQHTASKRAELAKTWPSQDVNKMATNEIKGGNVLAGVDSISATKPAQYLSSKMQSQSKPHARISRGTTEDAAATAVVPIDPRIDAAYDFNIAPINVDDDDNDAGNVDGDGTNSDTINYVSGGVAVEAPVQQQQQQQPPPLPLPFIFQQQRGDAGERSSKEFFTPLKYWAKHCQPGSKNCPKPYYRALLFNGNNNNGNRNSNRATSLMRHPNGLNAGNKRLKNFEGVNIDGAIPAVNHEFYDDIANYGDDDVVVDADGDLVAGNEQNGNNDIFMYLNGEQDVIKFLSWAMQLLYPHERFTNYSAMDADFYHPGMFIWKKLNLSGNMEPPFYADEPHYIIVRREQGSDDFKAKSNYNNNDDPFIPPRGRKHNMPDLDALLHRYETFVPNRGRRDKIKDMLKSDDLFFPNRGKRLKNQPEESKRDLEYENGRINHSGGVAGGKTEKNNNNKNDDEEDAAMDDAAAEAGNVDRFVIDGNSIDDNIENESSDNGNDDWYKTLPMALLMRDTLAKIWRKKLQNQHEKQQNAASVDAAIGNKITTKNPHQINYFSNSNRNSNNNNPEWLQAMLNYKFNGYYNDPTTGNIGNKPTPQSMASSSSSLLSSMPMAMTINGETREMSTPKATKNGNALMQLMPPLQQHQQQQQHWQQPQLQQFVADEIATGYAGGADVVPANLFGADAGAANRLLSTRSMSTAAALAQRRQQLLHQRQQQLQRQRQRLHHLNAAAMSTELNAQTKNENVNWQQQQQQQDQSNSQHTSAALHRRHQQQQLMPFNNLVPLLWRQLQLPPTAENWQQKRDGHPSTFHQPGFWPQEALRQRPLLSNAQRAGLKGDENRAFIDDYNYFDI